MGIYRGHDAMNEDTDYVHTAVVNFEPTYLAISDIAKRWADDRDNGIAEYRDELQDEIESHLGDPMLGLSGADLTSDVDYAAMIQFEAGV